MAIVIFLTVDNYNQIYTTAAFLIGGLTSIVSGWIAM